MQIWPAIDLRGGKCVRLEQGDICRETVYCDDPIEAAMRWVDEGAECLHVVDLDGACEGHSANREMVGRIVQATGVLCQVGGGIRDEASVEYLLGLGVQRLVVGTRALCEPDWFCRMCRRFPHRMVLGIDARAGRVATHGWLQTSDVAAIDWAVQFAAEPMGAIVYTDIARDGMMAGPNLTALAAMRRTASVPVIASGGITTVEDVLAVKRHGLAGCIIGRALYEGRLNLADAIQAARPSQHHPPPE